LGHRSKRNATVVSTDARRKSVRRTDLLNRYSPSKLPRGRRFDLLGWLTTDPTVLGVLAWSSAAITVLGFAVAIWQISKVRSAADAARDAALGLEQPVRSRELLAKLGDAHTHLRAARNYVGSGERQIAIVWLGLSSGCAIEAREILRTLGGRQQDLHILIIELGILTEQLTAMPDPATADPALVRLQLQLRRVSGRLQNVLAQSRYRYDVGEA
jgi:hypothetical protein